MAVHAWLIGAWYMSAGWPINAPAKLAAADWAPFNIIAAAHKTLKNTASRPRKNDLIFRPTTIRHSCLKYHI